MSYSSSHDNYYCLCYKYGKINVMESENFIITLRNDINTRFTFDFLKHEIS
jgi:hypothetical protein